MEGMNAYNEQNPWQARVRVPEILTLFVPEILAA